MQIKNSPSNSLVVAGLTVKLVADLSEGVCKGCKLGYDQGNRDISKAKCAMKVCCFRAKHLETCADCSEYLKCEIIRSFQSKKGFKYKKYKQSIEFIRKNGYSAFIKFADEWNGPLGKFE